MLESRVASLSRGVGAVAALVFVGVPLAIQLGLMSSAQGFPIFLFGGGGLGLLAVILGGIGLLRTREGSGRGGRGKAITGTLIGAAIAAAFFLIAPPAGTPTINDITTSPDDPPQFVAAAQLGPNQGRDMSYPESFAAQQREGYPDLAPIEVDAPPRETLERISGLVDGYGWELVALDEQAGRLEATDTSRIFRFVDDIVVRVRARSGGSVVDVRSKSREGRGDLGVNAARIRRLAEDLGS